MTLVQDAGRSRQRWGKIAVVVVAVMLAIPIFSPIFFRMFLFHPFYIPARSMMPTLLEGDSLFVSKYAYGYSRYSMPFSPRLFSGRIFGSVPERGDVVVFRMPKDDSVDYIKRVVGLPGDEVVYRNKRLTVNGTEMPMKRDGEYNYVEGGLNFISTQQYLEKLGEHEHTVIIQPDAPAVHRSGVRAFPLRDNCTYNDEGFSCKVPPGYYFMMGDNRDSSDDSRYWGFVPEANIVGKAFLIWWNFDDLKRIGRSID